MTDQPDDWPVEDGVLSLGDFEVERGGVIGDGTVENLVRRADPCSRFGRATRTA